MSLFAELNRRNVFKVAAAYVIVGWLIMQAGEVMGPALHLPGWVNSMLAFFLILGFPLALIFAWAFEMTPDGIKKEKEVDRAQSISHTTGQKLNFAIIALMAVALAYFAWDKFVPNQLNDHLVDQAKPSAEQVSIPELPDTLKPDRKSIAVLPFQNRSANEENAEFFSDGVHDELLTNLSRINDLKVISRTSVMSYRDTTENLRQIGEDLGVANILEGGVQRAGNSVRINVQLIDAATDEHLWAEVYDRQLTTENIFAIQTEIAQAISKQLEATLSPQEQALISSTSTTSLQAYDDLLMAQQFFNRGNYQDLRDAQSYLNKAIEIDPEFVQAYVMLARTYFNLFNVGAASLQEINTPWSQAIQTALSLDKNNASAYAVQAQYLWQNGQQGAEAIFEKALQLEPRNAEIITMYANYLRTNFYPDRALPLYEMAQEFDPISVRVLFGLARTYGVRREFDKALEIYTKIRKINPANNSGYGPVAGVYVGLGDMVQTMNWLFKALAIDPDDIDLYNWVALGYIDFGDLIRARQWLSWLEKNQSIHPMTLSGMAMLNAYEGNNDISIAYTRRAFEEKMSDRWGSDPIQVRNLLIWALDQGQTRSALEMLRQTHPTLFGQHPLINGGNALQAIDAAHLLRSENLNDEARSLLAAVIKAYEKPYAMSRPWLASGKAQALAMLGQKQAALDELREQVDDGWRLNWRWHTELNPNFESLREKPEFQNIIEILRLDMAQQYKQVQAMEASGEIPTPPGVKSP